MPGLHEGGLPLRYQGEMVDVEEERRLFYVGVTRARDILELSYAQAGSRRENRQPSRFLPEGHRPQPVAKRAAAKSPGCQVCGKRLAAGLERARGTCGTCPSDFPADLFEDLRGWRSRVVAQRRAATGKATPAFLVATDAVLVGIARTRPADRKALASVKGIHKSVVAEHADELLTIVARNPLAQ
jgi:DNA helicase-2/ATP-dependent DNA helicase PcrA